MSKHKHLLGIVFCVLLLVLVILLAYQDAEENFIGVQLPSLELIEEYVKENHIEQPVSTSIQVSTHDELVDEIDTFVHKHVG